MTPYRTQGERAEYNEKGDEMMYTSIIRWSAITLIALVLMGFGSCVAVNFHNDNTNVSTAPYQAEKAKADAEAARANADRVMWERMGK